MIAGRLYTPHIVTHPVAWLFCTACGEEGEFDAIDEVKPRLYLVN